IRNTFGDGTVMNVFENGQANSLDLAIRNAQMQAGDPPVSVLHYNPSHGGFMDTIESAIGKAFGYSSQANELRNLLMATNDIPTKLYNHSQGGITTNIAINSINQTHGLPLLGNLSVQYNGAAVNRGDSQDII